MFAREGSDVLISYLSQEEDKDAQETARYVGEASREAVLAPGDIQDESHCRQLVQRAVDELGGLNILVSNAAYQIAHESLQDIRCRSRAVRPLFDPGRRPVRAITSLVSEQTGHSAAYWLLYFTDLIF